MQPLAYAAIFLLLTACFAAQADDPAWIARAKGGMVASDSPEASQIGADILTRGGNAFDAAVATSLALTVCRPASTGIGGGGFMLAYVANDKKYVALDFREIAPACATAERYAKLHAEQGNGPSASIYGGNAVGVPGLVAGLFAMNDRWGRLQFNDCCRPVRTLAENGFRVDEHHRAACQEALDEFAKYPDFDSRYAAMLRRIAPGGRNPSLGDMQRRPDLSNTLRIIGHSGRSAFYEGEIAHAIVDAVRKAGGGMTLADLKKYAVREREPLRVPYREYEFVTMSGASGGVCLAEALSILNAASSSGKFDANNRDHTLVEALKHAFADRARFLGDADANKLPIQRLMSAACGAALSNTIEPNGVRPIASYGSAALPNDKMNDTNALPFMPPPDDGGTSHFCVADEFGNIVSMTETINGTYGSYVVVEPYGIILNNQMDDFTTVEGQANLFGLVQSKANVVAPGRRPLSSMSPTIILKDGKPFAALGASGGPRIISNVLSVALNLIEGQPLAEAIRAPRLHHQWQPSDVFLDRDPPADWQARLDRLKKLGHTIAEKRRGAIVQAIQFLPDGTKVGASDPKKGGRPAAAP